MNTSANGDKMLLLLGNRCQETVVLAIKSIRKSSAVALWTHYCFLRQQSNPSIINMRPQSCDSFGLWYSCYREEQNIKPDAICTRRMTKNLSTVPKTKVKINCRMIKILHMTTLENNFLLAMVKSRIRLEIYKL